MIKNTAVKGVKDILPPESQKWNFFESRAREYFRRFGFDEIRIPVFEKTGVFARGLGDTSDIVEKEMYTFEDRGGESLTLRPEGTASVVRAFVEHKLFYPPGVKKLYYIGPMFRCERPQAGRYRQFYQIGAELFGAAGAGADAETISMLMKFLGSFGLKKLTLNLNSLGCPGCRPKFRDELVSYIKKGLEQYCRNCLNRYERNPLRIFDCKSGGCISAAAGAPVITGSLCAECVEHFSDVKSHLDLYKIPYTPAPRLVRGLDYYSRTAFEITAEGLGAQNAVAGGGRYDQLVKEFGGPCTPAFGFAMGVERVLALIDREDIPASETALFVVSLGELAARVALDIVIGLRDNGIRVERDFDQSGLKSQMKRANRWGATHCLIIGENEIEDKRLILRNMKSGEQININIADAKTEILEELLKG